MFATYRHHAVFTDSPMAMLEAEASHRDHAIIEQVIADLKAGPLAHAPSGDFSANGAWTLLAAIAFNLTRAAATLACAQHARARAATIRAQLINIPARIANPDSCHFDLILGPRSCLCRSAVCRPAR